MIFITAAGAAGLLAFGGFREERFALPAIEAEEAQALCAESGASLPHLLERIAALGIKAVVSRPAPLRRLVMRGEALLLSREELDKWKAFGVVAAGGTLKPDTVWLRDATLASELIEAAGRAPLSVSSHSSVGFHVLQFAGGLEPAMDIQLYDPSVGPAAEGAGLLTLRLPADADTVAAAYQDGRWSLSARGENGAGDLFLEPRRIPVSASPAALWRAVYAHPRRLLVFSLSRDQDLEAQLALLRRHLRELSGRGLLLALPDEPPHPRPRVQEGLVRGLLWFFALLGPLFVARMGILALKRGRVLVHERLPPASPVLQLAIGVIVAAAAALAMGLAVRAGFDALGRTGPEPAWQWTSLFGPMLIAALTLYTIDPESWSLWLSTPVTPALLLKTLGAAAVLSLLIQPRMIWPEASPRFDAFISSLPEPLWWVGWRWREIFVGYPCLLHALFLVNWRMDCPECESVSRGPFKDPRGWFVLGLLAPIGLISSFSRLGTPMAAALEHSAGALLLGCGLGALLIAARLRLARDSRSKVPEKL